MTKEEIRSLDVYHFILETYMYAFCKNPTDIGGQKAIDTVVSIVTTPEGAKILNAYAPNVIIEIIDTVIEDLTSEESIETIWRNFIERD